MKTTLKPHATLAMFLGLILSAPDSIAAPSVTTTWSDATTLIGYAQDGFSNDRLDWSNGWWDTDNSSWSTTTARSVTPSDLAFLGTVQVDRYWSSFHGACSSFSLHFRDICEDVISADASPTYFPITTTLAVGESAGPYNFSGQYVGVWIVAYKSTIDGVDVPGRGYTNVYDPSSFNDTIFAARGTDTFTNYFPGTPIDEGTDPHHTAYSESTEDGMLTASSTFEASYSGQPGTQARLCWAYAPWSAYGNATSGGDHTETLVNPGGTSGPGQQISWPMEGYTVQFVTVLP